MHVVSSLKPFPLCAPEIADNQLRAKESWGKVFDGITYFNVPQPEVESNDTAFIWTTNPPKVREMVRRCADTPGWSCVINADIVVGEHFPIVANKLMEHEALCAMSQRYEFVGDDYEHARIVDLGLDFFAATQAVWGSVAMEIPETFVIGKVLWDYWLNNYFCEVFGHAYYDLTLSRVIFHPRHGHRGEQGLHMTPDRYMQRNRWAQHNIGVAPGDKPH